MTRSKNIQLLIRADDIGSSHAANLACIEAYTHGIVRSVELMVPCPWFEEASTLLNQHPDLDVGIHLTLTSEWDGVKWGPLTRAASLEEELGQFYPMLYSNDNYPPARSLKHQAWKLNEIEQEFRAQIELGLKRVPWASYFNAYQGGGRESFEEREETFINSLRVFTSTRVQAEIETLGIELRSYKEIIL